MPANLLKYSNGWGHLIMSVSSQVIAVLLLLQHDATLTGVATGLLLTVTGYWFVTSSGNSQVKQQSMPLPIVTAPAAPAPAPAALAPAVPAAPASGVQINGS